jgi:putative Holliday junction resolvase
MVSYEPASMEPQSRLRTVIGFDFGMRHIGVAVGQTVTMTARPYASLSARDGEPEWTQFKKLFSTWQPDALIVGVPFHLNGKEHEMTIAARQFIKELKKRFFIPVYPAEERLTSVEARARLFDKGGYKSLRKDAVDGLSAQLIVEGWLAAYTSFKTNLDETTL